VLAQRLGLAKLAPQPAQQAHPRSPPHRLETHGRILAAPPSLRDGRRCDTSRRSRERRSRDGHEDGFQ
jgi:hypothetical protein